MIVGAMRVKNESRWISQALRSILPVCSSIFVFDDHSTDRTTLMAYDYATVIQSPFPDDGKPDEARDKTFLVERIIRACGRCWILMIDGDEELAWPFNLEVVSVGRAPAYTLRVAFLWDRENQERVDGVYRHFTRPSLFDTARSNCRFENTGNGANFHCFNVPTDLLGRSEPSFMVLKHYGYLHREDRLRKQEWYRRIDPGNVAEDDYRHITIGDNCPPETVTRHAGPLELRPFHG